MENNRAYEPDGENFSGDLHDQIRQGPWIEARKNSELCPPEFEVGVEYRDSASEKQFIALDDVSHVTEPEDMGEASRGHSKIHFKEHLGKAALVVATGVILGGLVTIRKRRSS